MMLSVCARQAQINESGSGESSGESRDEMTRMRERCASFAALVPAAFEPPAPAVRACANAVSRNYASSTLPVGTAMRLAPEDRIVILSAGVDSHGDTTPNCIDHAFEFLQAGANGEAASANAAVRAAGLPSAPPSAPDSARPSGEAMAQPVRLSNRVCNECVLS